MKLKTYQLVIAGLLVAVALLLYFGVPANFLVGRLQSRIEADTGYHLSVNGGVRVGLLPSPIVTFRDVTLDDGSAASQDQFKVGEAIVALSLADLLRGRPRITTVTLRHPALRVAVHRQRAAVPAAAPAVAAAPSPGGGGHQAVAIDRIVVEDGTISFVNGPDHVESSIDRIDLDGSLDPAAGRPSVAGTMYWSGQKLAISVKSQAWPGGIEGQTIPVALDLQAPGLLAQPFSASAELRKRRTSFAVNAIAGRIGDNSFDGSVAVDFAGGKPSLKGELNFDTLQLLPPGNDNGGGAPAGQPQASQPSGPSPLARPWSNRAIDVDGLNFIDADVRLSGKELDIASFRFAPIAIAASVKQGSVQIKLDKTGIYNGEASGIMALDASVATPAELLQLHLDGVDALPLLSDVAGFQSLEGRLKTDIDVKATGASQQAVISSLSGEVDLHLSNGAVRGIDVAKLMHNLTSTILNGWQQNATDRTPLTDFDAHFHLANGVASTDDLSLQGPVVRMTGAGNVDIAAKTLKLKVDPQLVTGSDSSGAATGLGVPVDIEGDWSAPRIYPDVAGILDDPNSIYNQLRAAGKGLFGGGDGSGGSSGANNTINNLIQGLGNLLNGAAGNRGGSSGNGQ